MTLIRTIILLLAALTALVPTVGCQTTYMKGDKKYVLIAEQTVDQLPARVVQVADVTLKDLKMNAISSQTTNIDGEFFVRSALGREFCLVVSGVRSHTTLIQIYGTDPSRDHDQAHLIFNELLSRLR